MNSKWHHEPNAVKFLFLRRHVITVEYGKLSSWKQNTSFNPVERTTHRGFGATATEDSLSIYLGELQSTGPIRVLKNQKIQNYHAAAQQRAVLASIFCLVRLDVLFESKAPGTDYPVLFLH